MKIWKEQKNSDHKNWRPQTPGGSPVNKPKDNLIEAWQYFVKVAGFTFEFADVHEIYECYSYFSNKIHPSTKYEEYPQERWFGKWHEKLPKGLNKEANRIEICKALQAALDEFAPNNPSLNTRRQTS